MTLPVKPPVFPTFGDAYDRQLMTQLVKTLELTFRELNTPGPLRATRMHISHLPTSATGLEAGDLWNDLGTVKVKT